MPRTVPKIECSIAAHNSEGSCVTYRLTGRVREYICQLFMDEAKARGHSLLVAYSDYVNGSNPDGSTCNRGEHRRRGGVMEAILEEWLSCW